jgi:hypothetical protein
MDEKFHPSKFETPEADTPNGIRTLLSIREQRKTKLGDTDLKKLSSPGSYNLTENDDQIAKSNTKHLFKNLYGETLLTFLFFSSHNIQNLQNLIKLIVHQHTNYVIDNQSSNELLIIMRSIFLEYSKHPKLIDESMTDEMKTKLYKQYTDEVSRLNEIVINHIVPKIVSQLQQYLDYLRDSTQPPKQLDKPISDNISGERQYRSVTQVLLGGPL